MKLNHETKFCDATTKFNDNIQAGHSNRGDIAVRGDNPTGLLGGVELGWAVIGVL